MRSAICVATFVVLLLFGFVASPGVFRSINPEYLLALRELGGSLLQLTKERGEIDSEISRVQTRISEQDLERKQLVLESNAKQAEMATKGAPPAEIASLALEFGKRTGAIVNAMELSATQLKQLELRKVNVENSLGAIKKRLEATEADSAKIQVVVRALALGAIGAMMSVFAKFLARPRRRSLFDDDASMGRLWVSMAMGSVVSIVVVGLFFTGFISIFSNATQGPGETDFWKVTILCLLAGAFSDRLFESAAGRVETYLRTGQARAKEAE
jgi:hypothetical protein